MSLTFLLLTCCPRLPRFVVILPKIFNTLFSYSYQSVEAFIHRKTDTTYINHCHEINDNAGVNVSYLSVGLLSLAVVLWRSSSWICGHPS